MGGDRVAIMVAPVIFLVVVVAAMQSAEATKYKVGDDQGWELPPAGDRSFYVTWASGKVFYANDILEFVYISKDHTVARVSQKLDYDGCVKNNTTLLSSYPPTSVTLNSTGDWYFICTIAGHCEGGQKLAITVTTGSSSTPQTPPTGTPPSPPPPKDNSAAPTSVVVAAATSFIFGLVNLVYVVGLLH